MFDEEEQITESPTNVPSTIRSEMQKMESQLLKIPDKYRAAHERDIRVFEAISIEAGTNEEILERVEGINLDLLQLSIARLKRQNYIDSKRIGSAKMSGVHQKWYSIFGDITGHSVYFPKKRQFLLGSYLIKHMPIGMNYEQVQFLMETLRNLPLGARRTIDGYLATYKTS